MAASMDPEKHIECLMSQLKTARSEINNLRQQIKSLTHAHRKDCEEIQRKLTNWKCTDCLSRENHGQGTSTANKDEDADLSLKYIGKVYTQFPEKRATPRQPGICPDLIAKLTLNNDILTNPEHALEGLHEYSHMWILFHFHRNDSTHVRAKVAPPRLNGLRTGVFATRSPHRPCPIGLSLVEISCIVDNTIFFTGVDMVDGTPVLDIKPYIPQYDNPHAGFPSDNTPIYQTNDVSDQEDLEEENVRIMDGDENGGHYDGNTSIQNSSVEESFYNRSNSRIGEREAPDGEEGEEPPSRSINATDRAMAATTTSNMSVRVPNWIDQPRSPQPKVLFKDSVLAQFNAYSNAEAEEKIRTIRQILKEDPRSVYLRSRLGSNCYVFRIASLYVSCKFNDEQHTVTVFKISEMSDP